MSNLNINASIKMAKCFDFDSLEYYCPWCGLKLRGSAPGSYHADEERAWGQYECDYSVGATSIFNRYSQPISTIEVLMSRISESESWVKNVAKEKKRRKQELAVFEDQLITLRGNDE